MKKLIFAGNWKMHLGPTSAREFMKVFLQRYGKKADAEIWLFPPATSIEAVAAAVADRPEILVGAQDVYWEEKGAFTGQMSISMLAEAGGRAALVGHSERRHVFGETDEETGKKVRALLDTDMIPVLCVGEKLEQREAGHTISVVRQQLGAIDGLDAGLIARCVIAYEPVWAIGTGKVATPEDAEEVHADIKRWLADHGAAGVSVLYGGSVKESNVASLIGCESVDGVLVGGASLDPGGWANLVAVRPD